MSDLWTPTTQVVDNGDGTSTADIYAAPIQAPDPASETGWSPIDTTLQSTPDGVEPNLTEASIQFSAGDPSDAMATVEQDGISVSVGWTGDASPPTTQGDTATYPEVLPGIDAALQAKPYGFEQSFLVGSASDAPEVLDIPLQLTGLTATLTEAGMVVLTDESGAVVGSSYPAMMWGATTDPTTGEPTVQEPVATSLLTTDSGPVLELRPDPAFFTRPDVAYPLTIDPLVNLSVSVDTYVNSQSPAGFPSATVLKSGLEGGVDRALLSFSIDPVTWGQVQSASLDLWENWSSSCTATPVDLWSVTGSFDASVSWATQPAVGARYASLTAAKGFSDSCPAGTVSFASGGDGGLTVTSLVQSWADDVYKFPAVEIRARDEADSNQFKIFNSSEAASNPPVLHVTYDHAPEAPLGLSATGTNPVTLHGTFSDTDGTTGSVRYTVYDATGVQVYAGSGPTVASGTDSPLTLPVGTLQNGYTWKAQAFDGILYSGYGVVQAHPPQSLGGAPPWNVVVIMADDLDMSTFQTAKTATWAGCNPVTQCPFLRNYKKYFESPTQPGVAFDRAFVSYSLCCPSRASFLSGRYAHNTGVKNNGGNFGGCDAFSQPGGDDTSTIATWLHAVRPQAYTNALVGKYLNGYGAPESIYCVPRYIPPDWDVWDSLLYTPNHSASFELGYHLNQNNLRLYKEETQPERHYQTAKLSEDAASFIYGPRQATQPFFVYVAPSAPHLDSGATHPQRCQYGDGWPWGSMPTIRDALAYDGLAENNLLYAHPTSYNEPTDDKPDFISRLNPNYPVDDVCAQRLWWDRLESLGSVDDMIGNIFTALNNRGALNNTVVIFTSDNGYYNGEHRLHQKVSPYEEGIRVPLAIYYPALAAGLAGTTRHDFVLNNDVAPTIADLAGATTHTPYPATGFGVDGQSLYSLLTYGTGLPRERFLLEHWKPNQDMSAPDASEGEDFYWRFIGIRTAATPPGLDPPNVVYLKYDKNDDGFNDLDDQYEYYDNLNNFPSEDQQQNDCVQGGGSVTCPVALTDPLDKFLTALNACSAMVMVGTYACQALEAATTFPPAAYMGLFPSSGPPGAAIAVAGSGFPAGETLDLKFQDSASQTTFLTTVTASGGSFSVNVTVPSGAALGLGAVNAFDHTTQQLIATAGFPVT